MTAVYPLQPVAELRDNINNIGQPDWLAPCPRDHLDHFGRDLGRQKDEVALSTLPRIPNRRSTRTMAARSDRELICPLSHRPRNGYAFLAPPVSAVPDS